MGDVQADCPHLMSGFGCAATTLLWCSRAEHTNVCTGGSLRPGGAMRGRLMGLGPWGSAARHSSESHAPPQASKLSRLQITTGSRVWLNHLHFYTLRCKHARAEGSDSRFPEGLWCKVPGPSPLPCAGGARWVWRHRSLPVGASTPAAVTEVFQLMFTPQVIFIALFIYRKHRNKALNVLGFYQTTQSLFFFSFVGFWHKEISQVLPNNHVRAADCLPSPIT